MKKICAVSLLFVFLVSGCNFLVMEGQYQFRQPFDQIASIEILKKEYDSISTDVPMDVLCILSTEEQREIMDMIAEADGAYVLEGAGSGFGIYIIRITYHNGEVELIGEYNNGYITPEGKIIQDCYTFDTEQFYSIISIYLKTEAGLRKP